MVRYDSCCSRWLVCGRDGRSGMFVVDDDVVYLAAAVDDDAECC